MTAGRRVPWLNVCLYVLALLLASAGIFGAVQSYQTYQQRGTDRSDQAAYGQVLDAARATATAFVNVDYRRLQESQRAVEATATGKFLKEYQKSSSKLTELLRQNRSVMTGSVDAAAVDTIDSDSASVLVATSGTTRNVATRGMERSSRFRLRLDLVRQGGRWLTNNLEVVP